MPLAALHGLYTHLKLATAAAHAGLERVLVSRGYFDVRHRYTEYLQRCLAFHTEAEQALDSAQATRFIPDWNERRRAQQARADLIALDASESAFAAAPCHLFEHAEQLECEQVLGIAYVLEDSTLGGAFLLGQVAMLGISAQHGGSYLASYGNRRGVMWQRFIATLEEAHARNICAESVTDAALAAFAAARYYLTETEPVTECAITEPAAAIHARPRLSALRQ